ncbi:MAG: hypothetical protein ACYDDU_06230 [Dermatophilaceae bacterium]
MASPTSPSPASPMGRLIAELRESRVVLPLREGVTTLRMLDREDRV